jgi:putative phage-type endonuclease
MATKTKAPWRSGFCADGNPDESHNRCDEHPRADGVPCSCLCHMAPAHTTTNREGAAAPTHGRGAAGDPERPPFDLHLITPTGVLVTDAEPETDEWFAARREGITGTDLPKILGLTKYGNALSVWLDKRGELDDSAGEAALWGQILEDPVAQEWARRHDTTVTPVGVLANHERPWIRASLDRLVETCPDGDDRCGLEVKTRSAFKSKLFQSEIPDDVLAQTTWGLLTTGLHHMHVAVLIGGQELRSFRVDRDPKIEEYLLEAAAPVWAAVGDGVPPEAHPDSEGVLLGMLNELYSHRAGDRHLDPDKARPWLDQYAEGAEIEKQGEALKEQAKAGLVQLLDDGDAGLVDGTLAFTYKAPPPGETLSAANLRKFRTDQPEVYEALRADGYITPTRPGPRFDMKETTA